MIKIDKRQTFLLILTITVLILLGWQVYQLVCSDNDAVTPDPKPRSLNSERTVTMKTAPISNQPQSQSTTTKRLPKTIPENSDHIVTHQAEYLKLVNEYQIAKIQRQLLEEKVAIASARERIVTINKKTASLVGHGIAVESTSTTTIKPNMLNKIKLTYIGQQDSKFNATLLLNGQYITVAPGSIIAPNTHVTTIDENGLTIQRTSQKYHLGFNGIKNIITTTPHTINRASLSSNNSIHHSPSQKTLLENNKHSNPLNTKNSNQLTPKTFQHLSELENKHLKPSIKSKIHLKTKPIKHTKYIYTLDEILLLELPPNTYTIHIKGDFDKQKLITLARNNDLGENAIYYSKPQKNKRWYVLLYSYYNSKEDATIALQNLPLKIKALHPTAQSINIVQGDIKSLNG